MARPPCKYLCLSFAFALVLVVRSAAALAQQRPLQTQDPGILDPGMISFQVGFDFLQDAKYPLSGLGGDLTGLGIINLYAGLGEIVEFQIQGTAQNFLSINERWETPLDLSLNASETATNDFGDLVFSTKILLVHEKKHFPSLAFRPSVQLPNASAEKGLGLDSTQFYGTLIAGKHFGALNLFANVGLGILSNPVEAGVQNDVLIYGLGGIHRVNSRVNLVGEVYGHWSVRDNPPLGTESQSQLRFGVQLHGAGLRWDLAGVAGLAENSPHSGITFGVTKEFRAFRVTSKKK
jgi:hypothetical protein